jgi:hypothetical protein
MNVSMIEHFAAKISPTLLERSGKAFYTGRDAFNARAELYVLGFNPGGHPSTHLHETVGVHTGFVLKNAPSVWSAYSDETWEGHKQSGTAPMQRRVLHLFRRIGRDPFRTPCSNLIFVRSSRSSRLEDHDLYEETCWPFHAAVLEQLRPRIVVCLGVGGGATGQRVRRRLGAEESIGVFVEENERKWSSCAHKNASGLIVLSLTHPSIADWTAPPTDPSQFVAGFL